MERERQAAMAAERARWEQEQERSRQFRAALCRQFVRLPWHGKLLAVAFWLAVWATLVSLMLWVKTKPSYWVLGPHPLTREWGGAGRGGARRGGGVSGGRRRPAGVLARARADACIPPTPCGALSADPVQPAAAAPEHRPHRRPCCLPRRAWLCRLAVPLAAL